MVRQSIQSADRVLPCRGETLAICIRGDSSTLAVTPALPANFLSRVRHTEGQGGSQGRKRRTHGLTDTRVAYLRERYKLSHALSRSCPHTRTVYARVKEEVKNERSREK